jgi:hypothetical protein
MPELTHIRSSSIWGFGLAAAVAKPVKQVSRLAKLSAGKRRDKSVSHRFIQKQKLKTN